MTSEKNNTASCSLYSLSVYSWFLYAFISISINLIKIVKRIVYKVIEIAKLAINFNYKLAIIKTTVSIQTKLPQIVFESL